MRRAPTSASSLIADVALERARALAPWVLIAVVTSLVLSEPSHIPLTAGVLACNATVIAIVAILMAALFLRRVPDRCAHAVAAALWLAPIATTIASQASSHSQLLVLALLVEMACGAILLDTRWLVGLIVVVDALWIPLAIRDGGVNTLLYVITPLVAQLFAVLIHRLMLRSLLQVQSLRAAEAEANAVLASQLDELRRSEADRAALYDQLQHAQRMEAVGTLAAGIAHDMNNVLGAIMGLSGVLCEASPDPETQADLEEIVAEARRGAELTRGLLAFSRRGQYRKQPIRVAEIINDVVQLLTRTLPKAIEIRVEVALGEIGIEGDPTQLGQAIVNLGLNAADAMPGGGTLTIEARVAELGALAAGTAGIAAGRYACIRVTDTGVGMDEATRTRVFDPYFTTKPMGKGTGLGLALVWGTVQRHEGAVVVESALGRGSTFFVYLPVIAEPVAASPRHTTAPIVARRRATVLVIDDEPAVRRATTRILERMGHAVIAAESGPDGLRAFDEHRDTIDLVVLDMGMPVMGGAECFGELRERASVPVLIATGYALEDETQVLVSRGAGLIEKPYSPEMLGREVDRLLDRRKSAPS